jgi:hypothetical protein
MLKMNFEKSISGQVTAPGSTFSAISGGLSPGLGIVMDRAGGYNLFVLNHLKKKEGVTMRRISIFLSIVLLFGLALAACAPGAEPAAEIPPPTQQPAPQPEPTEEPVAEQPTAEVAQPEPAPTEAAPQVQHAEMPGELPEYTGLHMYDHNIITGLGKLRSVNGDRFTHGQLERPYNTDDVHIPYLDISEVTFYDADPTWFYVVVSMVGQDENNAFPAKYGLEADVDLSGKGTWLILVDNPSDPEWTTAGVQVWKDSNGDVGGVEEMSAENGAEGGDGYETLVFDNGQGDDPDAAWVRLSQEDPNSFEIAFKKSLFGTKFLVSTWAGTTQLDPALFDINDHFTHEQAGAMDPELKAFWPIKAVSELDNTCRFAIGFTSTGKEKGACPPQ